MKHRCKEFLAIGLTIVMAISGCASNTPSGESPQKETVQSTNDLEDMVQSVEDKESSQEESVKSTNDQVESPQSDEEEEIPQEESVQSTEEHEAKAPGKYPVKWDLTELYKNTDEWNADYDKVMNMLDKCESYKGTLNTAQNIYDFYEYFFLSELTDIQSKLYTYVKLGLILDATDPEFSKLSSKIDNMMAIENQKEAFADPEIFELSLEERKKIFSDPVFAGKEYYFKRFTDPDYEPIDEKEEKMLTTISMGQGYALGIFSILSNVELPYPTITMPDGTEAELTDELYSEIINSQEYDDSFKEEVVKTDQTRYKGFKNTFAALLEENCAQAFVDAQLNKYDSTKEFCMSQLELEPGIYDMLVDTAHKGTEDFQRFFNIKKKGLGLDVLHSYNLHTYVSDYDPGKTDYDEAVDDIISALSILGDEYIDIFMKIITSSHVDVYSTDTKDGGAKEMQLSTKHLPYLCLNYVGYASDISAIAHEMGHAVYDELSVENQPQEYTGPTIFTQEVASTCNELLFYTYKMNNAKDDEEKLYYLENILSMFSNYFFYQMQLSEFEDYMYKQVESGNGLDPEDISDKWMEILKTYRGDAFELYPDSRYGWASIPHFYDVYYVYQYAADVAYAASIADRISSGDEKALSGYLDFLKSGASAPPAELLSKAGIDPESESTYGFALDYYKKLVDEYERLVELKIAK